MFHEFINRYRIKGRLRAVTGIHIGASTDDFRPGAIDNQVLKDVNGQPFIPGSSLKGVCRSHLERVFRGMGKDTCIYPELCSDQFNSMDARNRVRSLLQQQGQEGEAAYAAHLMEQVCQICHLFGSGINAGKIQFHDARAVAETMTNRLEMRTGVSIDRDTHTAIDGPLYQTEVVPAGTEFVFELTVENASRKDEEPLLFLLQELEDGNLTIGGLTTRGLGKFRLVDTKIDRVDQEDLKVHLLEREPKTMTLEEAIQQFQQKGGATHV